MRLKEGFPLKYGAVPLTQNGKEVDMEEKICSLSMRQIFSVMELIGQTYVIGLFSCEHTRSILSLPVSCLNNLQRDF